MLNSKGVEQYVMSENSVLMIFKERFLGVNIRYNLRQFTVHRLDPSTLTYYLPQPFATTPSPPKFQTLQQESGMKL